MKLKNSKVTNLLIVIFVLIIFLLYLFILTIFNFKKSINVGSDLNSKIETLNSYERNTSFYPSKEMVDGLQKKKASLEDIFKNFSSVLAPSAQEEKSESDPLKFKEELLLAQTKIREVAKNANLSLPDSLGFTKYDVEIPATQDIPVLKNQLKIIREIIGYMSDTGIKSLNVLNVSSPVMSKKKIEVEPNIEGLPGDNLPMGRPPGLPFPKRPAPNRAIEAKAVSSNDGEEIVYDTFPVKLELESSTSSLIKFIYKLRTAKSIFIIKNLEISSIESKDLKDLGVKSELDINAIVFVK